MIDIKRDYGLQVESPSTTVLLDDTFTGIDARDILAGLLDSSVNFYKLRSLHTDVHTETPDLGACRCIDELRAAHSDLKQRITEANDNGLRIRVRTTFELIDDTDDIISSR